MEPMQYVTASNRFGWRMQIFQFAQLDAPPQYGAATLVMWQNGAIVMDRHLGLFDAQTLFKFFTKLYNMEIEGA